MISGDKERACPFQSTRPSRGATAALGLSATEATHFNPRAPRGARRNLSETWRQFQAFQSTRPSRGATCAVLVFVRRVHIFQSTRPSRGATGGASGVKFRFPDFNPRAPRGARPILILPKIVGYKFQSTRPSRGATTAFTLIMVWKTISIHAPLAGRDCGQPSTPAR